MAGELVYLSDVAPYGTVRGQRRMAGVHRSLGSAARAFEEIAFMEGLGFTRCEGASQVDLGLLARTRLLVLFTIGETAWHEDQRRLIESRVTSGSMGLLGLHAATDSAYGWDGFERLIGARFDGHPVTGSLPISVVGPPHPATNHIRSPWWFKEELYLFTGLAPDATVLLAVDPAALPADQRLRLSAPAETAQAGTGHAGRGDAGTGDALLPLAWCIQRGAMRTFYTVLGHFLAAYEDACYLEHLAGAVRWLLGEDAHAAAAPPG